MPSGDAILTLASGYQFKDISTFLLSLNRTDFTGTVCLVVNEEMEIPISDFRFHIMQFPVKGLRFDTNKYKVGFKEYLAGKRRRKITRQLLQRLIQSDFSKDEELNEFIALYHCQVSRYAVYLSILLQTDFNRVFLTDSRDVYFQQNLFAFCKKGLYVFQENRKFRIKDRWYNNQWVRLSTNFFNYLKVREKFIFCSGTILGDKDHTIYFLKLFIQWTLRENLHFDIKGIDQGLFNVLIHNNEIKGLHTIDDHGFILTLSSMKSEEFQLKNEAIYNTVGIAPAVVHQYDRHPTLIHFVNSHM